MLEILEFQMFSEVIEINEKLSQIKEKLLDGLDKVILKQIFKLNTL